MGRTLLALMAAGALALGVSSCGNKGELMGSQDDYPKITSNPTLTVNEGQTYNYQIEGTDIEKYSLVPTEDKSDDWLSVSPTGLVSGTAPRIKHEITIPIKARGSKGSDNFTQEFNLTIKEVIDYAVSLGQSIQNAIDSAPEGSKIGVRSGTYNQNLNVNKRIFLVGIDGEVYLTPAINSPVVTISASGNSNEEPLFLRNFNIYTSNVAPATDPGKKTGIWIASASPLAHIGLEDIVITGNNIPYSSGLESGVSISPNVSVDDLEIENSHFKNLSYGFISGAITSANPGYLTNLKMKNTILEHNSTKGFYVERLSDSLLENVTVKDNGNILLCPSWADPWNSGMDINLKYGNYKNITIKNLNATGNGIGHTQGTGLTIKARGTGSDSGYSSVPAHLAKVYVLGGIFSGNNSDIRFGEIGKGNTSPTEIIVRGVQYTTLINALSGVSIQN